MAGHEIRSTRKKWCPKWVDRREWNLEHKKNIINYERLKIYHWAEWSRKPEPLITWLLFHDGKRRVIQPVINRVKNTDKRSKRIWKRKLGSDKYKVLQKIDHSVKHMLPMNKISLVIQHSKHLQINRSAFQRFFKEDPSVFLIPITPAAAITVWS